MTFGGHGSFQVEHGAAARVPTSFGDFAATTVVSKCWRDLPCLSHFGVAGGEVLLGFCKTESVMR